MPRYTVEIDGKRYIIEGDRPPSEQEARDALKDYTPASEQKPSQPYMRSRTGQMYTPPAESGGKEFLGGLANATIGLPGNIIGAGQAAYEDPKGALKQLALSPIMTAKGLLNEPAATLGNLAGGALWPPGIRGTNRLATKVVESVPAQKGIGGLAGLKIGGLMGHPIWGAGLGAAIGEHVVKPAARAVELLTGGRHEPPPVSTLKGAPLGGVTGRSSPPGGLPIGGVSGEAAEGGIGTASPELVRAHTEAVVDAGAQARHDLLKTPPKPTKAPFVQTPQQWQAADQIQAVASHRASRGGMQSAARAYKTPQELYLEALRAQLGIK